VSIVSYGRGGGVGRGLGVNAGLAVGEGLGVKVGVGVDGIWPSSLANIVKRLRKIPCRSRARKTALVK
jgi:hypothetical protein